MSWSYTLDGLAVALDAQRPGDATRFSRVSTDTRTLREGDVFFALKGERFDGHEYIKEAFAKGAVAVVASEAVHGGVILRVPDTLMALQQFAAWHRNQYRIPIIAITGSCGKTSTKDLTAAVLATRYQTVKTQGNLNNEIGCPLSLLQIDGNTGAAVLEMGANHRGEIARLCEIARPTESAITLVAEAHLEGFGTIGDIASAKAEIMEGLPPDGVFYVNLDNPYCQDIGARYGGKKVYLGSTSHMNSVDMTSGGVWLRDCRFTSDGGMELDIVPLGTLRLPLHARAHATNVLFAIAIGWQHGIEEFEEPLRQACAEPSRFKVLTARSLTVIDDSYNANPASMRAALQALHDRPGSGARHAALGTMLELGPESKKWHHMIGELAGQLGVSHVFAYGPEAQAIVEGARAGGCPNAETYLTHEAIAQAIRGAAQPGDVLLVKGSRGMTMEKVIELLNTHTADSSPALAKEG